MSGIKRLINFIHQIKYIISSDPSKYLISDKIDTLIRQVSSINIVNARSNFEENVDSKEPITSVVDIVLNAFEDVFIDLEFRVKALDNIASVIKAAKSKEMRCCVHC